MKVNDLLAKKSSAIQSTTPTTTLLDAIGKLNEHNIGALLVLDKENLAGIITERDVLHASGKHEGKIDQLKVEDFMSKDLITCSKNESVEDVMGLMTMNRIRHLPILEDDKLVGIISIGDVVKAVLKKTKAEADDLKEYIHGRR